MDFGHVHNNMNMLYQYNVKYVVSGVGDELNLLLHTQSVSADRPKKKESRAKK